MLHSLRKCVHEHACLRHASLQDIGTVCAPAHFAPASIVRRFCAGTGYATGYGPRSWLGPSLTDAGIFHPMYAKLAFVCMCLYTAKPSEVGHRQCRPLDERTFHRVADMTFEYLQDELDVFLEDNVPEGEISYEV